MSEQVSDAGPILGSQRPARPGPMYRLSREPDHALDPKLMRALLLAAGVGGVALAGFGVWKFAHHGGGEVPVIEGDPRPMRVRPENPGGMAVTQDQAPVRTGETHLAPPTEEPDPHGILPKPAASVLPPHVRTFAVQLKTVKSEAAAQTEWDRLAAKFPALFGGRHPLFQKANEAGPMPWRLRTGGFTDAAQAKAFCDQLKAKGVACTVSES